MITTEQLKKIIADCAKAGHTVKGRDIAYAILCLHFEDPMLAYKSVFGLDLDFVPQHQTSYDNTSMVQYLKTYMEMYIGEPYKRKDLADISFEENKAYMLKLKSETELAMTYGEIEKKDGLKILADISTRLNDKFQVVKEETRQHIYVSCKFNAQCVCGREIYIPTKEDLMEKYNLVEKTETK